MSPQTDYTPEEYADLSKFGRLCAALALVEEVSRQSRREWSEEAYDSAAYTERMPPSYPSTKTSSLHHATPRPSGATPF